MDSMMQNRILILEDDKDVQYTLMVMLMQEGYEVEVFSNGYPLFDKGNNWPGLFILDINLPGINGLQMCKWLKEQDETRNIPVLLVSSSPELEVLASDVPCDGYLARPFTQIELLEKINSVFYLAEQL
jgi:DNA-binding response OmpR family regulator